MSFQVRQPELGIFQGTFLGLGFWHPSSDQPEQGFCEFPTEDEAREFIKDHVRTNPHWPLESFIIEPFDREQSNKLVKEGHEKMGLPVPPLS